MAEETLTGRAYLEKLREDGELAFPSLWELQQMDDEIDRVANRGGYYALHAFSLLENLKSATNDPDAWCRVQGIPLDSDEAQAIRGWAALRRLKS